MVQKRFDFFLILVFLAFSFWLMFHTFGFDPIRQYMRPASTVWSDFGSHIPLIRSFSMGNNWPPEYPLFPGQPIRYHFLFYAIVGLLERVGIRIDWAFNIPSALGLGLLLSMIYVLAKKLFKSKLVGILSVIFFLFNGTFAFLSYFNKNNLSWESLTGILTNTRFPSFGPWDGGLVSAFWNLNIYTNQRHLGLSFGLALLAIYLLFNNHTGIFRGLLVGCILGFLLFTNQAALFGAAIVIGFLFFYSKKTHVAILLATLTCIPFLFFYMNIAQFAGRIDFRPWYLLNPPITVTTFLTYWFYNLGFHLLLIPLGFIFAPKEAKKLFLPIALLFILANMFQFSPDMINNHKFFNFVLIVGNMFSAYALVRIARRTSHKIITATLRTHSIIRLFLYSFISLFVYLSISLFLFFLTFSGFIDFMVIANDPQGHLPDINANPDAQFFATRTKPNDVILNSYWFYHPASLAGRSIYSGYAYFTWSYGYNKDQRESMLKAIYNAKDKITACKILGIANIAYVELSDKNEGYFTVNWDLWNNEWTKMYRNDVTGMSVYSVMNNCTGS